MSIPIAEVVMREALACGAIKLRPDDPFTWTSGYRMPIYNDNRKLMHGAYGRGLVGIALPQLLSDLTDDEKPEIIAGVATAGISPATTLANRLFKDLIYVRSEEKKHGLENKIEGSSDISGVNVVMVEDSISTGKSSIQAIKTIRDAGATCNYCLSIFTYGFEEAKTAFEEMSPSCEPRSLFDYEMLINYAVKNDHISENQHALLREWREGPFGWGEKNGFPKVE